MGGEGNSELSTHDEQRGGEAVQRMGTLANLQKRDSGGGAKEKVTS